jgi:hypothetical protein
MTVGIKESLELVALVKTSADTIKAAKADGSIDWKDLAKLGPELMALKAAVQGAASIKAELSDLDADEAQAIYAATFEAVTALADAILN